MKKNSLMLALSSILTGTDLSSNTNIGFGYPIQLPRGKKKIKRIKGKKSRSQKIRANRRKNK
jgi:hypothetical protein